MGTPKIEVRNRIAVCVRDGILTSMNSGDIVEFDFDAEWSPNSISATRTARFIYDDNYIDIPFNGNTCPMPAFKKGGNIYVSVYWGNIRTTTPAIMIYNPTNLDGANFPKDPPQEVYNRIIELMNEKVNASELSKSVSDILKSIGNMRYCGEYSNFETLIANAKNLKLKHEPTAGDIYRMLGKGGTVGGIGVDFGDYIFLTENGYESAADVSNWKILSRWFYHQQVINTHTQQIKKLSDNPSSYTLPIATGDKLGGVKIGGGLQISKDGLLSVADELAEGMRYRGNINVVSKVQSFEDFIDYIQPVDEDGNENTHLLDYAPLRGDVFRVLADGGVANGIYVKAGDFIVLETEDAASADNWRVFGSAGNNDFLKTSLTGNDIIALDYVADGNKVEVQISGVENPAETPVKTRRDNLLRCPYGYPSDFSGNGLSGAVGLDGVIRVNGIPDTSGYMTVWDMTVPQYADKIDMTFSVGGTLEHGIEVNLSIGSLNVTLEPGESVVIPKGSAIPGEAYGIFFNTVAGESAIEGSLELMLHYGSFPIPFEVLGTYANGNNYGVQVYYPDENGIVRIDAISPEMIIECSGAEITAVYQYDIISKVRNTKNITVQDVLDALPLWQGGEY